MQDEIDPRAAEIANGMSLDGHRGAYWRFLQRADLASVFKWIAGEKLRGTPPEETMLAVSELVADLVTGMAQNVPRHRMKAAARQILTDAVTMIDPFLDERMEAKKQTAIHRTGLHVVKD